MPPLSLLSPKSNLKVCDFRPTSLCNVIYKIIAKVLANRLKMIIHDIITPTQSVFIPGRLIKDNILIAYKTLHTLNSQLKAVNALWLSNLI